MKTMHYDVYGSMLWSWDENILYHYDSWFDYESVLILPVIYEIQNHNDMREEAIQVLLLQIKKYKNIFIVKYTRILMWSL